MKYVKADDALAEKYIDDVPDLVHATGPISYDYHFGRRGFFNSVVKQSWRTPGTLFSSDTTTLALDGDELTGILISFLAPEYRRRVNAGGPSFADLLTAGETTEDEIAGLVERSDHASWLNPVTRPGIYYVHALSVKPAHRGRQIGVGLMSHAMDLGRRLECKALQLDVLSDNPAVDFYRSMGLELLVESRAPKPEEFGVPPECRMGINL